MDLRARALIEPAFGAVVRPFQAFFRLEAASGILLLAAAAAALGWANSPFAASYVSFFATPLSAGAGGLGLGFTLLDLVNEGLMTVFFFVVGLEVKRELAIGELSTPGKAALPAFAALGGMVVPAAVFAALNAGGEGADGWGVPIATDIAFAVGALTLLRRRVPHALLVFVTALAIFDDIGGIVVIALVYGHGPHLGWLAGAAGLAAAAVALGRAHVRSGLAYAAAGAALWYALHHGGIHATIAGVVLGLAVPARPRRAAGDLLRELCQHATRLAEEKGADEELRGAELLGIEERIEQLGSPLARFEHALHPWVAFGVMPLFALANSGVSLAGLAPSDLAGPVALGVGLGLVVGKTVGVFGLALLAVRLGIATLPVGVSYAKLLGASILAGIGFTVALFIAALAYYDAPQLLAQAKVGILVGSLAAGVGGSLVLRATRPVQ
jgi:NhaA family Na+:H+ antiporter